MFYKVIIGIIIGTPNNFRYKCNPLLLVFLDVAQRE